MENTAEAGGFDLLSAALTESGLTDDLDFSDLLGLPSNTSNGNGAPAIAEAPDKAETAASQWEAKAQAAVPKQTDVSTEVDLFSQALQQLTAINKQAGAFTAQAPTGLPKPAAVAAKTAPAPVVSAAKAPVVPTTSHRPRMAQFIDALPPAPRDEVPQDEDDDIVEIPQPPKQSTLTQPHVAVATQITGVNIARPTIAAVSGSNTGGVTPGQQGVTVVRAVRPGQALQPGTIIRTVRGVNANGQQVVRTVQTSQGLKLVQPGQQVVQAASPGTVVRGPGGTQVVQTLPAGVRQQVVRTAGQQVVRAVQSPIVGQQIIRTTGPGGQQIIRTTAPGGSQIIRTTGPGGQQIIRTTGATNQAQLLKTLQQLKGTNGPIQIIQTRPNGSPITVSSATAGQQLVLGQNNTVQVKSVPQTVQLTSAGGTQPHIATIVNSSGASATTPQTVSILTTPKSSTPTTSTGSVTRIPAKIVQQIGPDGTTRLVRIVTVSPGMLNQQQQAQQQVQQQQGVASKGITITKVGAGGVSATMSPATLLSANPGGTRTIHIPQNTTPGTGLASNAVTVIRPSNATPQKLTIAPRTGTGNRLIPSVPQLNPALQHRVSQPVKRSGSPLTVSGVASNMVPKPGTPPPTNGVIKTQLSEKDVSRLWANDEIKFKKLVRPAQSNSPLGRPDLGSKPVIDEEDEDEELGHTETYADYVPAKLKIGEKHPDSVVETSSLSSVEPPDVWYKVAIPESTIDYGSLSALQLESIVYASQKHEIYLPSGERAGYLIGDGAGVGKGRTIAGIIFENYLQGRKRALWLSVSNDLRVDAERDLRDIGAGKIEVYPLNKFKYAKISSKINGSVKKGVIFSTYSSLIGESQSGGKYRTRLKQLLHWLDQDFDGVIVFDECHKAKNLCPVGSSKPTKTGSTVVELQNKLPKARIIYASATGASEPRNMAYMTRLGLWGVGTPFREFTDFINAIEKRGVGAMELVAMDMKLRGMYIARQLSFHGVSFKIQEIPVAKDFVRIYNQAVKLWVDARAKFQLCAELIDAEQRMKKSMWGQFWSAHQRFFKYLCISSKVPHCVKVAREAVKNGKCVVIGLQSTGEARTLEQLEESGGELNDFVSTAKGVFQTLVEKHFPAPDRRKTLDMFGLGSSLYDSPASSPKPPTGSKRKRESMKSSEAKKSRLDLSDDSDSDSSVSAKSSSSSESELSLSESESEQSDSDNDDFNPFGNGSDSDDDPWLKKQSSKKPKKEKKKKEKKKKEKKPKKEKKKKKKVHNDSDDDIDDEFDRALEAAGLKGAAVTAGRAAEQRAANSTIPGMDAVNDAVEMKRELLAKVETLGDHLPPNTLDQLIDLLGGTENVAEMTGRKGRVVSTTDGVQYESRSEVDAPLEILNLTEKQRFMDGEKNIAIISEAASSGISLQADRRAINQRRRVHITLELPWSADRAIQQFGRTHRSNQVSAPQYVFMISELAGERRFAATVARRLESLGALTHGDRRATESRDLSQFNIDNKYGRAALEAVMKSVLHIEAPIVPPPEDYHRDFFEDVRAGLIGVGLVNFDDRIGVPTLEKDYNNISKFLNRILGMEVELQNALFGYFTDTLTTIILQAKRNGRWDMGILDLGGGGENVRKLSSKNFTSNFSGTPVKTTLHSISVERGMTWEKAFLMWREHAGPEDGFYLSAQIRNGKRTAMLVVGMSGRRKEKLYSIYRPNTGLQLRAETLEKIKATYRKVLPDDVQPYWQDQFELSSTICTHAYWRGNCKRTSVGLMCEVGVRCRTYHILGGSVLGCWTKVEAVLASLPGGHASRMQIIRIRTDEGERIVGTLVPDAAIQPLTQLLSQDVTKMQSALPAPSGGGFSSSSTPGLLSSSAFHHSPSAPNLGTLSRVASAPSSSSIPHSSINLSRQPFSPLGMQRSASTNSFQSEFASAIGLNGHRSPPASAAAATATQASSQSNNKHLSMPLLL